MLDALFSLSKHCFLPINSLKIKFFFSFPNKKNSKQKITSFLKLEKEIKSQNEGQSTEQMYTDQMQRVRSEIEKLENQLNVVQKRCGDVMSDNASLRASIDHLLLER